MAVVQSVMIKNKLYDGVRLTIVGSQSGNQYYHYSEAIGNRYYVNLINSTQSALEAVTFDAYLSFTSSTNSNWEFNLVPMDTGHTVILNTQILGMKSDGSKGFVMNSFGAYRHAGSSLTKIGGQIQYTYMTDFTGATAYFTASGTSSINLVIQGTSGETIDWDCHIKYTKGNHSIVVSGGGPPPAIPPIWYPSPPDR